MKSKTFLEIILSFVLIAAFASTGVAAPSSDLSSYVLLARDKINFQGGTDAGYSRGYVLGGNVGVNKAAATTNEISITVGQNGLFVMSPGTHLVGDRIALGTQAQVWDVYVNYQNGSGWNATNTKLGGSTVQGTINTFTPPIFNPWPTTADICGSFAPVGTTDINVPKNGTLTLTPGAYQDVNVMDGGTLYLQAGTYTVRRFTTGQVVNVYTVPGTIIHIWGDGVSTTRDFNLGGNGSYFGGVTPSWDSKACICVDDAFNNSALTDNNNTIQFSDNGTFWGVIYAPGSDIGLGHNFTHYARFVAKTISTDVNDNITTAIELSGFEAIPGNNQVILNWSTETENDNAGFNIYRAESEAGEYIKINNSLIPAKGSSTEGASYQFVDTDVQNRKTYYYKLEDIDLNGTATMHGPVSATPRWVFGIFGK